MLPMVDSVMILMPNIFARCMLHWFHSMVSLIVQVNQVGGFIVCCMLSS